MIRRIKRDRRSCAMWAYREGWKIGRVEDWKGGRLGRGRKRLNRESCDERIAMIRRIKRDRRSCAMWAYREGWKIGRVEDWKGGRLGRGRKRLNRDSCDERIAMIRRIKRVDNERDRDPVQCGRIGKGRRWEGWKIGRLGRGLKRLNWDSCDERIAMIRRRGLPVCCRSDLQVAILYAISMNASAEQDAPPTMWVGMVREDQASG